jgi:hypothetical protein
MQVERVLAGNGDEEYFSVPISVYPSGEEISSLTSPWGRNFRSSSLRASLEATKPEGLEGLNSPSYSILNNKGNLAPPILSGFIAPKLALIEEFPAGNRGPIAISRRGGGRHQCRGDSQHHQSWFGDNKIRGD